MDNTKKNLIPFGPSQQPWSDQVPSWATVTGPLENPIGVYDAVPPKEVNGDFPEIDYSKFELPPNGLSASEYKDALKHFRSFIETQHKRFTGYQTNEYIVDNTELSWMLDIHTNNVGDPFTTGIFALNTKFIERAVLDYFAALWRADWPFSKNSDLGNCYWGYVLSMGATEGNIYSLYNAREYLSGKKIVVDPEKEEKNNAKLKRNKFALQKSYATVKPIDHHGVHNKYRPIAFFSEDTHYSIIKGLSVCSVTSFSEEGNHNPAYKNRCPITKDGVWPDEVPSHNKKNDDYKSGTIVVKDLEKLVEFFLKEGHPILIILNQGSTWKGAYDDVPAVNKMLLRLGKKYPWLWEREVEYEVGAEKLTDVRRGFWVHIDGALGAAYLPFLRMAQTKGELHDKKVPEFDFSIPAVMSIVCSMHKWIGAPWPGGIYMTKKKFQVSPPDTAGYIGSPDTTLGGSRNGFSPVLFWKYFAKNGYKENIERALETERVAALFESELRKLEKDVQKKFPNDEVDFWIHRSHLSLAVVFRKINADITYKYTVDSETITEPVTEKGILYSEDRTYSHVYSMTSLGKNNLVEQLIADIRNACKVDWRIAFPDTWSENGVTVHNPGNKKRVK